MGGVTKGLPLLKVMKYGQKGLVKRIIRVNFLNTYGQFMRNQSSKEGVIQSILLKLKGAPSLDIF